MYRMYGMSRCQGWQGVTNVQDVRTDICSGNICTSTIHGGRMSRCQGWQGATHIQDEQSCGDDLI
jgi:hypothetical protein